MKLLIVNFCILCASVAAQDRAQAERDMQKLAFETELRLVKVAISQHQSLQLNPLDPKTSVSATGLIGADGNILRLAGVEIRTDSLIVQADNYA